MLLEPLLSLPEEGAIELLISTGIKKNQAARIYRQVQDSGGRERMLSENILDALTDRDDDLKKFKSVLQSKTVEWLGGQTDEPVTSDTHRLIRLPGSLHGKTGLKVVSLTRDQLATFDPLRDAVPDFGDETVLVHSAREFVAEPLGGHALAIREGQNEIPLPLGLFLILRRQVTLAPKQ
jgi:DNA primase small subunit